VLGDHGFLRKYGSTLSAKDIEICMRAAADAGMGLAAGDERCLKIAARVAGSEGFVLYHTDARFFADDRRCQFPNTMATLRTAVQDTHPAFLDDDPIMGAFLDSYSRFRPYRPSQRLALDERTLAVDGELARLNSPTAISVGGDYLDALIARGREDLVLDCLGAWANVCDQVGASLVFTTYLAGWMEQAVLAAVVAEVAAVMVPMNAAGFGMLPDRDSVIARLADVGTPVIAMHPLGSGRISARKAVPPLLSMPLVISVVAGASTPGHLDELITAQVVAE
jgi:hypothetical protein